MVAGTVAEGDTNCRLAPAPECVYWANTGRGEKIGPGEKRAKEERGRIGEEERIKF